MGPSLYGINVSAQMFETVLHHSHNLHFGNRFSWKGVLQRIDRFCDVNLGQNVTAVGELCRICVGRTSLMLPG